MSKKRLLIPVIIFIITVLLSPILILWPGWILGDTGEIMLVLKHDPFGLLRTFYTEPTGHRFFPLALIGMQLVSYLSFSPEAFYTYSFILALASLLILTGLSYKFFNNYWFLPILLIFTPGFTVAFYDLYYPEKELLLLWSLFLALFLVPVINNPENPSKWMFLSILPASYALYVKEFGFIMLGSFCIVWVVRHKFLIKNKQICKTRTVKFSRHFNLLLFLLFFSALWFIAFYLFRINSFESSGYLNISKTDISDYSQIKYSVEALVDLSFFARIKYFAKALFELSLSDPFMIFVVPLLWFSARLTSNNNNSKNCTANILNLKVCDSLSLAAMSYTLVYLGIGYYSSYYLLPAYPFAIIASGGYLVIISKLDLKISKRVKFLVLTSVLLFLVNAAFSSLNLIYYTRASSKNFMKFNSYFMQEVNSRSYNSQGRIRVIVPDSEGSENEFGYRTRMLSKYLKLYEIAATSIDFYHWDPIFKKIYKEKPPEKNYLSVLPGDLLIFVPNRVKPQKFLINQFKTDFNLREIIATDSHYYFQLPEFRYLLKHILIQINPRSVRSRIVEKEVDFALYEVK
jgi:hypothetical protein